MDSQSQPLAYTIEELPASDTGGASLAVSAIEYPEPVGKIFRLDSQHNLFKERPHRPPKGASASIPSAKPSTRYFRRRPGARYWWGTPPRP